MKITYEINEEDFLEFQVHKASISQRIQRKKRNQHIGLTIGCFIVAIYFYLVENWTMTIFFILYGIICGLFFKRYFDWRYKKHYKAHIKENYKKRFGQIEELEFLPDVIKAKDIIGEGTIRIKEIDRIDETNEHYLLNISTGQTIIIPKNKVENIRELTDHILSLGIEIKNFTNQ